MLGAIIGDIVGSIYEFRNIKTKEFELFGKGCNYTDDSILTLATADWLLHCDHNICDHNISDHSDNVSRYYGRYATENPYPMGGYGSMFKRWAITVQKQGVYKPYNSCGNGSAMRVGPVGWYSLDKEEVLAKAEESAACTHNHPEGIKGAQATALCILMARKGSGKENIRKTIEAEMDYDLSMSVKELQRCYSWEGINGKGNGGICQDSVPQAIICALNANDFEDAVRNAISIGGDSDTIGCITGAIAEALYGIQQTIYDKGMSYLTDQFKGLVKQFEEKYGNHII